ncbi:MAG TPA: saccharopine dehydrogenase C-terminal domain-containing protein [Fimbriimonas sp.]|nr:saccharopine dehydrogenase C-terminal domain-containing protein [Fimbriimonas sp.]
MNKTFVILGAGMQGTAAAYDLAKFAEPEAVILADARLEQAESSASRVNNLTGKHLCKAVQLDALDLGQLQAVIKGANVVLSCLPYWMHIRLAPTIIGAGVHMCDLGGNTDLTLKTLDLDDLAKDLGVSVVPDTGLAPGLVNSIGSYLLDTLEEADTIRLYCGVLPQNPKPPFNYKLTFNIEGLVAEYDEQAVALRDGEIALIDTLEELEELDVEGLGRMEAFTTSGGTSTAPYTFQGRVKNYEYKTIRFPGHCEKMHLYKDFGFWSEEPRLVDGVAVIPRKIFLDLFNEALKKFEDLDQCIVRGVGLGVKDGRRVRMQVDIHDKQCEKTGFTSMERLTGFSIAIHANEMAEGRMPPGCIRYENAIPGGRFLEEIQKRGIHLKFSEERLELTEPAAAR